MLAGHTVAKATEGMNETVVEIYSDATEYKPQVPSKSIVEPSSDIRSEIGHTLADISVVTKTDVKAIVENLLTKWTNTQHLQIFKAGDSTLQDALQASYSTQILASNPLCSKLSSKPWVEMSDLVVALQYPRAKFAASSRQSCSVQNREVSTV